MKKMSFTTYFFIISISLFVYVNASPFFNVLNKPEVKFLITSSSGFQFQKDDNYFSNTVNITYDCSVGLRNQGIIYIFDSAHPDKVESIIIKNCNDITLHYESINGWTYERQMNKARNLKKIILENINSLNWEIHNARNDNNYLEEIYISDVKDLKLHEYSFAFCLSAAVTIKNTTILNLKKRDISRGISQLHLENVKIKELEEEAISLDNREAVFTMRDTHFEYIGPRAFFVNGFTVEIYNNSFNYLDNEAFHINASEKFIFSDNYVKKMVSAFNVTSPNIQIVRNNFDIIRSSWLSGITVGNTLQHLDLKTKVLNVSQNFMKFYNEKFYKTNPYSNEDIVSFNDNKFTCSCQYWNLKEITDPNSVMYILLRKSSNNVCENFDNCALTKVLSNMNDVCEEQFKCSEEKIKLSTESYLEIIVTTLKNIVSKLDWLTSKLDSSKTSNEISPNTESTNTTDSESY